MAVVPKQNRRRFVATREEKEKMRKLVEAIDAKSGIVGPPTMTIEELHASQLAHGIRPEDNGASRELLRMRYGDDYEQE